MRFTVRRMMVAAAAEAVVANPSIGAAIGALPDAVAGGPAGDDTFGVADDAIAFVVAEGGDPSKGVFDKLARANAS